MPVITSATLLEPGEKILFQIKEGSCNRGCFYCYERGKPQSEMPFEDLRHGLKILKSLNINEAEIIGSEPTEHSRWNELLNLANDLNIGLTIYTSGLHLSRLADKAIKQVILHVMFVPDDKFMNEIGVLLAEGKAIYLRVNFDTNDFSEKEIIFKFLERVSLQYRRQITLAYSFTSKTEDKCVPSTEIDKLKRMKPEFLKFCGKMNKQFPALTMYSERPLFKCCFTPDERSEYSYAGLDFRCHMEYTIYEGGKMALCPPAENLVAKRRIATGEDMMKAVHEIRKDMNGLVKRPSFKVCEECSYLKDESCQGGCLSYKL